MHPKCPEAPVQFQSCGQSRSLRAAPCWFPLAAQGHPLLGGRTLWVGLGGSRLALLSFRGAPDSWGGTRLAQRSSDDSGIVRKVVVQQVASAPGDALRIKDGRSKAVTSCGLPRPPSIPLPCGLLPPPPHPTPTPRPVHQRAVLPRPSQRPGGESRGGLRGLGPRLGKGLPAEIQDTQLDLSFR